MISLPFGIIPARAGFTRSVACTRRTPEDHPRSRGVYAARNGVPDPDKGSSPLARGLPRRSRPGPCAEGDHPRSRGVYGRRVVDSAVPAGSSPLARGLQGALEHRSRDDRIIPARAGFTRRPPRRTPRGADHPRSRGVYYNTLNSATGYYGSSPLARGLPSHRQPLRRCRRIIPARAGFTPGRCRKCSSGRDHPRSRGVYGGGLIVAAAQLGSSPLARGLRGPAGDLRRLHRIIPARAGFTRRRNFYSQADGDHPRSRGVYACHFMSLR